MPPEARILTFPSLGTALEAADAHAKAGRSVVLTQGLDHATGEPSHTYALALDVSLVYADHRPHSPAALAVIRRDHITEEPNPFASIDRSPTDGPTEARRVERSERREAASRPVDAFFFLCRLGESEAVRL